MKVSSAALGGFCPKSSFIPVVWRSCGDRRGRVLAVPTRWTGAFLFFSMLVLMAGFTTVNF